jgi:hypothetical protein
MNKATRRAATILAFSAMAMLSLASARADEPQSPAVSWLTRLKALEGEWKGTTPGGKPVRLSYKSIAGGTAVMEVFSYGDGPGAKSMYTIYHLDGDHLMLTHYCVSNNQPRMRAELPSKEQDVLRFSFVDATNLNDPKAGHMHRAMLRVVDEDHIANEWTYRKDSKDVFSEGAAYERMK